MSDTLFPTLNYVNSRLYSNTLYTIFFSLLGMVYIAGLFVPLMDNDAAHHANIALHMYLNHDYVNLFSSGKAYLDKPHFLFWTSALSYQVFGVTTFAYKLPSFLFTIVGTFATYKMGVLLYDREVGKLAALIIASAFAYILSNNDVRMEAILTSSIAIATWQGVAFVQHKKIINAAGMAVGLALGFSMKGQIAVVVIAISLFFYLLYRNELQLLYHWKWLFLLILFSIFISPVVYCYYVQFNQHPAQMARGSNKINGVKFILLGQGIERFTGNRPGSHLNKNYFFFLHSFIWAFAPWSILAYMALVNRIKFIFRRQNEWLTPLTFLVMGILFSFSASRLPHYINIIFPAAAVMTASFLLRNHLHPKTIFAIQSSFSILVLLAVGILNSWAFPAKNYFVLTVILLLFVVAFLLLRSHNFNYLQKSILISFFAIVIACFLLNTNFYPKLLTYQAGGELARKIKQQVDANDVYLWKNNHSSSFNFYTATNRRQFDDSVFLPGKPVWLLFDKRDLTDIQHAGYKLGQLYHSKDFEVTRLNFKFINPATRSDQLTELVVAEITGKK